MVEVLYWASIDENKRREILERSQLQFESLRGPVADILHSVESDGDTACVSFTEKFDGVDISGRPLRVQEEELAEASRIVPQSVKLAITKAVENVRAFHARQVPKGFSFLETSPSLFTAERATPIASVGLYVPRGKGSFPSMLYMLAVPATIAGVQRVVVTTPPLSDGSVCPACLYAAELCGVTEIYRVGGAQGVAALAYGTESIPRVDKIIGPGSSYVTTAMRLLDGTVDVGLPAGPSESAVLADEFASAWKVALDLTIEAEHGSESQALLITPSAELATRVAGFLPGLIDELPEPRSGFVRDVMNGSGGIIVTESMEAAISLVNQIAPEHLSIQTREPWKELPEIQNAGEILLGEHTPFSVGNYAAGANAVLPTGGRARTHSPVSVRDFMKFTSIVYATETSLAEISETVTSLADYEGFPAHARAIRKRSGA